jgi:diguanylate cyclase (GGDEF)-like protein
MQSPSPDQKTNDALAGTGKQSILIVDDHPPVIAAIKSKLNEEYTILTAESREAAMELALAERPDLVLLETRLPDLDGFEFCRQLKADPQTEDIPVIFLTAHDEPESEIRGLEAGAIDYIVKPIRPATLALRLNNHLALKRTRDLLYNQSLVDSLTGIGNRRCFEDTFSREWYRAMRHGTPISLALIDLDHFQRYSQNLGRRQGEECLSQVARMLKVTLQRWADTAARYGGSRFVAIMPQTSEEGARRVAERVRAALAQLAIPHGFSDASPLVTLSIGLASCVPAVGQDPVCLLRAANDQLLEAIDAGRDQVR